MRPALLVAGIALAYVALIAIVIALVKRASRAEQAERAAFMERGHRAL